MNQLNTPEDYETKLLSLAESDEKIVVMTAENRAPIRNLPDRLGERFIDLGICEQTMIGAAAGLCLRDRVPVVHALASFLTMRAFEFVRTDVGVPALPVKLVGTFAGFLSEANGPTHQAIEDVSLMRGIPNVNVWCPSDEDEMLIGLESILKDPAPYYIRYNNLKSVVSHETHFCPGKAEVYGNDRVDILFLTYGYCFTNCYRASDLVSEKGISSGVINMRTLKPVDSEAIISASQRSDLIVIVEDHFKVGGLYSICAEILLENNISTRCLSISFDGRWFKPALTREVLEHEGFTPEAISQKAINHWSKLNN